jgi:hypothetical protein
MILGGLLLVGHSFFADNFPGRELHHYVIQVQVFLFLLFLKGHILTEILSKKFGIYIGQVFLGFSVTKLIFAGLFILYIKRFEVFPVSKSYILLFMFSYFTYLLTEVVMLVGKLNKEA